MTDELIKDKELKSTWTPYVDKTEPLVFSYDLGSIFLDDDEAKEVVEWVLQEVSDIVQNEWHWNLEIVNIFGKPNQYGVESIEDVRKKLYINFASRDDAMLVRLSVMGLQKVNDADGRRLLEGDGQTV